MSKQQAVVILLLNVFLTSFVCAQYGSPAGNSNPGDGGSGTSVPSGGYGHKGQNPVEGSGGSDGISEPEPFNFAYHVKDVSTNTDFKHEAYSDGKQVIGEYRVLLPDGRNQVMTYVADKNGYNAKVNFEAEAKPQPPQPGTQEGYPSAPSFTSTAPQYPPTRMRRYGLFPRPAGYPVYIPAPAYGSPASNPGSGPLSAPGYIIRVPTIVKGDKGSSRPKPEKDTDYIW